MDAQELRNLQEAYLDVYQELDEISTELAKRAGEERMNRTFALMQKDWKEGKKKPSSEFQKSYKKQQDGEKRYRKKLQQEQVDLYDIILSHLLDEGYAETQEQAEVIMVNMSEEWRESICENVSSGKSRVTRYVQSKPTGPVTNRELDVSRQKRMDAENDRIKKIGDEAHAAATSKGLSFAEAEFRRKRAELRARKNS